MSLFRIRAFTASVFAIFLAAMGFFAAIVFLPRWFQVVGGTSATESGYQILPLLAGLIMSAIVSGQIVARTGRYKALIGASLLVLAVGLFLLTNLRSRDRSGRSSGSGWRSPAWGSGRRSRSSRWWCRTPCRSTSWGSGRAA